MNGGSNEIPFTEDIRMAPNSETVCYCSMAAKMEIIVSYKRGADSLAEIKAATAACTQGRCRETSPRGR